MSTRDEYIEKVKAQLDEWNATIDKLEARAQKEKADAKLKYESQIKAMKEKRDAAREKIKNVTDATDDAWETLKHESGKLLEDMVNTLTKTKEAFLKGLEEKS